MTVDLLLLIALTEEADELAKVDFYPLSDEHSLETFKYRDFTFIDCRNVRRSGRLVCAGEVGDRCRDAATHFFNQCRPKVVLNVGISGRIKDARVGDVVVPSYVQIPGHRGTIVDAANGGYREIPGGNPTNVSSMLLSVTRSAMYRSSLKFPSVEAFALSEGLVLSQAEMGSIEKWRRDGLLGKTAGLVEGPFGVGPSVIKSENYKKEFLAQVDRNFIAVDMESASIAAALVAFGNNPEFFSIRGISDPANEHKKDFDAVGSGVFRRWAMANIRTSVRTLLETSEIFATSGGSLDAIGNVPSFEDYLSDYPGLRLIEVARHEAYDDRFSNLQIANAPNATFSDIVQLIASKRIGGRVLIHGHGGSGKSALLKKIEIEMRRKGDTDTVFMNVSKLLEETEKHTTRDLVRNKLSALPASTDRHTTIFLDELYGNEDELIVITEIESLLADRNPSIVMAFGQDHYEVVSVTRENEALPHIYDSRYDLEIEVKAISIRDTELATKVIRGIIETSLEGNLPNETVVLQRLRTMGFLYINHFIVSIYLDNWEKKSFKSLNSTQFILKAMELLYDELYRGVPGKFPELCVEALRACSRGLAKNGIPPERKSIADRYKTTFAHFPKIIQTTLAANAIVYLLRLFNGYSAEIFQRLGLDADIFFGLVFTGDVNNGVKELMQDERIEEVVVSAAQKVLRRADDKGLSYAIYLFGRVNSARGLELADVAMREIGSQFRRTTPGDLDRQEKRDKFWRLARRSWHISRAMKNDWTATDDYIEFVLTDPYEDELNRSFHLEYYGDYKGTGITVELDLKDLGGNWGHTRDILGKRIERVLNTGAIEEYDRICLLTYFSIVRYRHETGKLLPGDRSTGIEFLSAIEEKGLQLRPKLAGFLGMTKNALQSERYDRIDAIVELFKLKVMPRYGWASRKMYPPGAMTESISSHIWGTLFLAETLGDYAYPGISDAERYKLSRLLLHHDVGEAYNGDYDPRDGVAKAKEPGAVERIASLAVYDGMTRIKQIRSLFDEFEHGMDNMAALARNFDKLDPVFQGYIFASNFPDRANRDEFFRYYLDRINNNKLLELAEEIVRRANLVTIFPRSRGKTKSRGRRPRS